jgi:ribosome-binding protein aMBF1 (putative translation factor)
VNFEPKRRGLADKREQTAQFALSLPTDGFAPTSERIAPFSQVFRRMRRARQMTRAELAAKAGLASAYIREVENGRLRPTSTTLAKLAEGLGVSLIVAHTVLRVAGGECYPRPQSRSQRWAMMVRTRPGLR